VHPSLQAQLRSFLERASRPGRALGVKDSERVQAMLAWRSTQKAGETACHVWETLSIAISLLVDEAY